MTVITCQLQYQNDLKIQLRIQMSFFNHIHFAKSLRDLSRYKNRFDGRFAEEVIYKHITAITLIVILAKTIIIFLRTLVLKYPNMKLPFTGRYLQIYSKDLKKDTQDIVNSVTMASLRSWKSPIRFSPSKLQGQLLFSNFIR